MEEPGENIKEFTFTWKIENYSMCKKKNGEAIRSPRFIAENIDGSCWYLKLYPGGNSENNKDFVSCYLYRSKEGVNEIAVFYTLDIIDTGNNIIVSRSCSSKRLFKKSRCWGFNGFVKSEFLDNELKKWSKDLITIRCRIRKKQAYNFCNATTKIEFNRFIFHWNVKISNLSQSKKFFHSRISFFEITLTALEDDILFKIKSSNSHSHYVKCNVALLKVNEVENESKCDSHLFEGIDDVWNFPAFISKRKLDKKKKHFLKADNSFNLKFEFTVSNGTVSTVENFYACNALTSNFSTTDTLTSLSEDFSYMLSSKKHADVQLRIDDQKISVHKCVLSSRSPVLLSKFDCATGVIDIFDMDLRIANLFVHFLYTGSVGDVSYEITSKLLLAAYKYKVLSLIEICTQYLISILSAETACETLKLGDMTGHVHLRESAFNYITSNPLQFLSSSRWTSWVDNNNKLGSAIFCKLSKDIKKKYD